MTLRSTGRTLWYGACGGRLGATTHHARDAVGVGKNDLSVIVKHAGMGHAGKLTVDDDATGTTMDGLDAGQDREVRFDNVHLKQGGRTRRAVADSEHAIPKFKEDNNELKVTARCQG